MSTFVQVLDPLGTMWVSTAVALVPLAVLLFALAVLRLTAWLVVIIASVVTVYLAVLVWNAPIAGTLAAYGLGAATGLWSVGWIVFWGIIIYNTLVATGAFAALRGWLIAHATADIRAQTMLLAWAFGALLEGLVGFGYPWAVVAPILITLGVADLAAIRIAAIANNAPVSFGALGAPIIALSAVTGLPLGALSASIGKLAAVLAIAPPFVLIYLVSGRRGLRDGWPLGVVAAGGYIAGQLPTSQFLGPYLPDVIGSLTCLAALLVFLRHWRPRTMVGFGGVELTTPAPAESPDAEVDPAPGRDPLAPGASSRVRHRLAPRPTPPPRPGPPVAARAATRGLVPFAILVAVVVAWTGPWSPLPSVSPFSAKLSAAGSLGAPVSVTFSWTPFVAGTAILVSWLLIAAFLRPTRSQLATAFRNTFSQMWGALLVAPLIFGLATLFNYAGLANTLAAGFASLGVAFVLLAPVLGWIAVALSGSNTSANAIFGAFQASVGRLLGAPVLLFPSLNSLGAEIGKPIAPQSASVGVATTRMVRNEGQVIRYNAPWTLGLLAYVIVIGAVFYVGFPDAMRL